MYNIHKGLNSKCTHRLNKVGEGIKTISHQQTIRIFIGRIHHTEKMNEYNMERLSVCHFIIFDEFIYEI